MTKVKKSVDLPAELTASLLIRGALALEHSESERTLQLLKKGLEKLVARKVISNRVAWQFKQLKAQELDMQRRDTVLTGSLVDISITVGGKPNGSRFFQPKDIIDVTGHKTKSDHQFRFMQAFFGKTYKIVARAHDKSARYKIVIAIDGRSIITGEPIIGDISQSSSWGPGYILQREETFDGWRESDQKVRDFVFENPENSFAGKWDDFSAMGTIVIAVFREDVPEQLLTRGMTRGSSTSKSCGGATRSVGTGFGKERHSEVERVSFKSKGRAYEIFTLNYQYDETLKELGVWTPPIGIASTVGNRMWPDNNEGYCNFPEARG